MKKRMLWLVLVVAMILGDAAASAALAPVDIEVNWYDYRNDLIEWQYTVMDLSEEETRKLARGQFQVHDLLPLEDGALLMVGMFNYMDIFMEESHQGGFEQMPEKSEAYAMAIDSDGKRIWSLRFGDPQAYNDFQNAWRLEDGRILLRYLNRFGEWGSHFFIVSADGVVEEMLPTNKLREAGKLETFRWMGDGFFGGGYQFTEDGAISAMTSDDEILFVNEDYSVAWRLQDPSLVGANTYEGVQRTADGGFVIGGSIYSEDWTRAVPSVLKLTKDGEIGWRFSGHEYAMVGVGNVWPTADGGVIFAASGDPLEPTPIDGGYKGTLVKLNDQGEHEWTRFYDAEGFEGIEALHPLGDGYLAAGPGDQYKIHQVMYVDAAGEPLWIGKLPFIEDDNSYAYMQMEAAPEGGVYVYGAQCYWTEEDEGYMPTGPGRVEEAYHVLITEEMMGL